MILYLNACARRESRTDMLAKCLLGKLGEYEEIKLYEADLKPLDGKKLEKRTEFISKKDYSDAMFDEAKRFAAADIIVIAAPYWDLSFPSVLKTYIENIYVTGIVSRYGSDGRPVGLCRAKKLYYVTTAGGPLDETFGYGYIKNLALFAFGIDETELIKAEMLDVWGYDAEKIIKDAEDAIKNRNF